jgi:hypothetical protein
MTIRTLRSVHRRRRPRHPAEVVAGLLRERCGCSCGCHNKTHTGYRDVKCQNKADWLPEYRVWACKGCLMMCDE